MSEASVNFLRRRRQKVTRSRQLDRRILWAAIIVAVVAVVLTIAAWGYQQVLAAQLRNATREERAAQAIISQQTSNEAAYLLYSGRLKILQSLLVGRGSQRQALEFLSQLTGSDVTFDRISYDHDQRILTFRIQAQNVLAVENLVERLREPEIRQQYTKLQLSNTRRDETKIYTIEVRVELAVEQKRGQVGRT